MALVNIKSLIIKKSWALLEKLPAKERKSVLLSGGGAAFLFGSDRPFSYDYDFEVSKKISHELRNHLGARFFYHRKKPIFHSLKAEVDIDDDNYDLIAETVVQPPGRRDSYIFYLTDEIVRKRAVFKAGGKTIYCVPKELLLLIKLLAGRGKELNKYDLYDAQKILEKNKDFDFIFFKKLIKEFLKPLTLSVPLLLKNAKRIPASKKSKNITSLVSVLEKFRLFH